MRASDHFEERFEHWFGVYESTPRWRLWKRRCALVRFELFLELMTEAIREEMA